MIISIKDEYKRELQDSEGIKNKTIFKDSDTIGSETEENATKIEIISGIFYVILFKNNFKF